MKVRDLFEAVSMPLLISKLDQDAVISYDTKVSLLGGKKNEQVGRVTKTTQNHPVTLIGNGGGYEAAQKAKDPNFVLGERRWGNRNAAGLIEHKGELYVEYMSRGKGQTTYFLDGQPIDKAEIVGLPKYVDSPIRCLKVSSLTAIS